MTDNAETISDLASLRTLMGEVSTLTQDKEMPELDTFCKDFIGLSPFAVIGSVGADGHVDVTPRGDPPGFVYILDSHTLILPERPGNRRVDTMQNLLANPQMSIIFFIPGYEETLRVRGRGSLTTDPDVLALMAVKSKTPIIGIHVEIDCVFFHCAKAIKRARLWDPEAQIAKGDFPRFAEIVHAQRNLGKTVEEIEEGLEETYRDRLY